MHDNHRSAADFIPTTHSLKTLQSAARHCQGCDLYKKATQTVFGEGSSHAPLVLVGEQPGNKEDLAGKPFVGPAGRLLHQVMKELEMEEDLVYVTNTVKHFKFEAKRTFRQHRAPNPSEIHACVPWIHSELKIIQPKMVLCLGSTAAKALINPHFQLVKERGTLITQEHYNIMATYHPSALLRAKAFQKDTLLINAFKADLLLAYRTSVQA